MQLVVQGDVRRIDLESYFIGQLVRRGKKCYSSFNLIGKFQFFDEVSQLCDRGMVQEFFRFLGV